MALRHTCVLRGRAGPWCRGPRLPPGRPQDHVTGDGAPGAVFPGASVSTHDTGHPRRPAHLVWEDHVAPEMARRHRPEAPPATRRPSLAEEGRVPASFLWVHRTASGHGAPSRRVPEGAARTAGASGEVFSKWVAKAFTLSHGPHPPAPGPGPRQWLASLCCLK